MNTKSDGFHKLPSCLKSRGVPVGGVGWQMHAGTTH